MLLQTVNRAETNLLCLLYGDDEASPMQLHAWRTDACTCHQRLGSGYVCPNLQVSKHLPLPRLQPDFDFILLLAADLIANLEQATVLLGCRSHGHCNPHLGAVRCIYPRMIGNREGQRQRILGL